MSNHDDESRELHFEHVEHSAVKYDDRDLGARGIIGFFIILGISVTVLCVMVWGYFHHAVKEANQPVARTYGPHGAAVPPAFVDPVLRFPQPTLQPDDAADMAKLRERNEIILHSYGWVDQKAGVVHVPIERAMEILAQRGLPVRPPVQLPPAANFGSGDDTVAGQAGGTRPQTMR